MAGLILPIVLAVHGIIIAKVTKLKVDVYHSFETAFNDLNNKNLSNQTYVFENF